MLIDTHSHLFLEEFSEDLPQVMERARKAGVSHILYRDAQGMPLCLRHEPAAGICHLLFCHPIGQIASIAFMPAHQPPILAHPYKAFEKGQIFHFLVSFPVQADSNWVRYSSA